MYTLIDETRGSIFHCECYASAVALAHEIKAGYIINQLSPIYQDVISAIRATWEKGGQQ